MSKKKIPTAEEIRVAASIKAKQREEESREKLIHFLQDKSLKMYFHFSLGLESLDYLKVTEEYKKELKLHGNRFLAALEKNITPKIDALYENSPEFTQNMQTQMDELAGKWSAVLFGDYPVINKMADEFKKDPERWRDNVQMQFNRLDADLIPDE